MMTGDVITVNFRLKGGEESKSTPAKMDIEGQENLVDLIELKEDKFLTKTNESTGAIFNLGDPDRLLTSILPYLELTATLKIRHSGIIKGKSNWNNWEYT